MAAPRLRARPSATDLVRDLEGVEDDLVAALELAAGVAEALAEPESLQPAHLRDSSSRFVGLMRGIHQRLVDRAHVNCDYVQQERSPYVARKEADVVRRDAELALRLVREARSSLV